MAPCPRCGRENPPTSRTCPGCGTPLALFDEPAPGRLDVDLDLDRRRREPAASPVAPAPDPEAARGPFEPELETDRSDWRIGTLADASPRAGETGEPRPAPPARRAAAWAVDGALLLGSAVALPAALLSSAGAFRAAGSISGALAGGLAIVVPSVAFVGIVGYVYATVAHALAGATLGKRLAGIRVIGLDGRPPGFAQSAARTAWAVISLAGLGLGLLPALRSPSGRALHDLLAGTRVVEASQPSLADPPA